MFGVLKVNNNFLSILFFIVAAAAGSFIAYKYFQKDPNSIVVGVSPDYPPFTYKEGDKLVGLEIDLANLVGEKIGKKVVFSESMFLSLIGNLQSGRIDVIASGMSPTPARLESFDFSNQYHKDLYSLIVKDNNIKSLADLKNERVAVQTGTLIEPIAHEWEEEFGFKLIGQGLNTQIIEHLKANRVKGMLIAASEGAAFAKENNFEQIILKGKLDRSEGIAMATQKGSPLTQQINNALAELDADGTLGKLKEQYGLMTGANPCGGGICPVSESEDIQSKEKVQTEDDQNYDED